MRVEKHKSDTNVSVIVLAKNEENNLPRCLEALKFTDDVLVVDDSSEDRTKEVAGQMGARVMSHKMTNFAEQRNWAMEFGRPKYDWVLHLDADEVVTKGLADEISEIMGNSPGDITAFYLARKTMLGNKWLRYSATYPAWVARLLRRGNAAFVQDGHGEKLAPASGKVGYLKFPLIHFNFSKGWADWFERHNKYSTFEAEKLLERTSRASIKGLFSTDPATRRKAIRSVSYRLPFRPWLRFFYVYFLRLGFLDGRAGLTYTVLQAIYEYMICLKVSELRRKRGSEVSMENTT